jgi:starch phosphorylase
MIIQKHQVELAYFSMEMMLESDVPTYAGGLGVLAGDILRSCADMHHPAIGVTLVYSGDTFNQIINIDGSQSFGRSDWQKLDQLTKLPNRIEMEVAGQRVTVMCWRHDIVSADGFVVPVYLLDTNILENPPWIRDFTQNLYGTNGDIRLCQELILGIGGIKMLRSLGYQNIKTYHLNEGHTAFATLELLAEHNYNDDEVRQKCIFTSHTPVPEGHDKFGYEQAYHFGAKYFPWHIRKLAGEYDLAMTRLAANLSHKSFAVSEKHQQVMNSIFPDLKFDFVTNGVHHRNWTAPTMQNLYNHYIPDWFMDPTRLIEAPDKLPDDRLWEHHQDAKNKLMRYVNSRLTSVLSQSEKDHPSDNDLFDINTLTIALARRPVPYKRPLLLYHDIERLIRIGAGKIQIIQCGKSHPDDPTSQSFVQEIVNFSKRYKDQIRIVYLENYSPKLARILVSGTDIWLNTPKRPLEASGTSGMKASFNGVLNFSILDGWWIEGYRADPDSGFNIGGLDDSLTPGDSDAADADDMYRVLENDIIPLYYNNRSEWIRHMKQAIALGSIFNTHRVVSEYQAKGWNVK